MGQPVASSNIEINIFRVSPGGVWADGRHGDVGWFIVLCIERMSSEVGS